MKTALVGKSALYIETTGKRNSDLLAKKKRNEKPPDGKSFSISMIIIRFVVVVDEDENSLVILCVIHKNFIHSQPHSIFFFTSTSLRFTFVSILSLIHLKKLISFPEKKKKTEFLLSNNSHFYVQTFELRNANASHQDLEI